MPKGSKPKTSKYLGVSRCTNSPSKYVAQLKYGGRNYYFGLHDTEEKAAKAYCAGILDLLSKQVFVNPIPWQQKLNNCLQKHSKSSAPSTPKQTTVLYQYQPHGAPSSPSSPTTTTLNATFVAGQEEIDFAGLVAALPGLELPLDGSSLRSISLISTSSQATIQGRGKPRAG